MMYMYPIRVSDCGCRSKIAPFYLTRERVCTLFLNKTLYLYLSVGVILGACFIEL